MAKHFQVDTAGTLLTGLLAYYKLSADALDFFGSNNLTASNITYPDGAAFNGSNSALYRNALISGLGFSISFRFKLTSNYNSGNSNEISLWNENTSGQSPACYFNHASGGHPGSIRCYIYGGANCDSYTTTNSWVGGTWYNFVMTCDTSGNIKFYINGADDTIHVSAETSGLIWSSIIAFMCNNFYSDFSVNGSIKDIGIWTKILSTQEITDLHNGGNGQTMVDSVPFIPQISFV